LTKSDVAETLRRTFPPAKLEAKARDTDHMGYSSLHAAHFMSAAHFLAVRHSEGGSNATIPVTPWTKAVERMSLRHRSKAVERRAMQQKKRQLPKAVERMSLSHRLGEPRTPNAP